MQDNLVENGNQYLKVPEHLLFNIDWRDNELQRDNMKIICNTYNFVRHSIMIVIYTHTEACMLILTVHISWLVMMCNFFYQTGQHDPPWQSYKMIWI
jgi:hypothetical protein